MAKTAENLISLNIGRCQVFYGRPGSEQLDVRNRDPNMRFTTWDFRIGNECTV